MLARLVVLVLSYLTENTQGRVTSFYSRTLDKYTSFRTNPLTEGRVQYFLFNEKGIIVLGSRSVHMANRRGLQTWPHLT